MDAAETPHLLAEAILRTMRQPLLVLSGALVVETGNRAFYDLFQVDAAESEGRRIFDLGNGQWDIPELRRLLETVLPERGEVQDFLVVHDFERIGRRTMLLDARRMTRADGGEAILLAIEDVTEREAARRELEAQKLYVEKIVDSSHDAILVLDLELRVRTANETFYRTFGVEPEQTIGRPVYELGNGQWNIPELRRLLQNVLPDDNAFDDFEIAHAFETIGLRTMRLNARRVDHLQLILLAIEDRTEALKAKAALRDSEGRYRLLFESIGQGFCVVEVIEDAEGRAVDLRYLDANPAFARQTGLVDAVGRTRRSMAPAPEESVFEILGRVARTGTPERFELPSERIGAVFEIYAFPVGAPAARQVGVLLDDVTERKRAERRQAMLMAELDHRVKNVLAVVQSIARQSLRSAGPAGEEAAERLMGRLSALAQSHGLLASARWTGARFADLVENALAPYRADAPDRVRVAGPDLRVAPKAAQSLTLALHELATNAAKYGGLSRRTGRVTAEWRLTGAGEDARLILDWRETGGPPIERRPGREGFGTRLIRQSLSYELRAQVSLDFAPEGLRAVVDLPLAAIRAEPRAPGPGAGPPAAPRLGDAAALNGKTILVAEDEPLVAQETAEALRSAGCALIGPVPDLAAALRAAETGPIDAAVLDVNLVGGSAWPVAAALRSRGVPFVFATAYSGLFEPPPTLEGAPWIEKPVEPGRLAAVLAALVEAEPAG